MAGAKEPEEQDKDSPGGGGGRIVDPTKNVLDLVKAESKYQDGMRGALEKFQEGMLSATTTFQNFARDAEAKYLKGILDSETRRIDQLAALRQEFQNTIRDMLAESVRTTSTLVSTQLVQIQATFDTRVSKLEAAAFTQAGRSSVADPQIASSLAALGDGITAMQKTFASGIGDLREAGRETSGRGAGRDDAWKYATGAILVALAVAAFYIKHGA